MHDSFQSLRNERVGDKGKKGASIVEKAFEWNSGIPVLSLI